MSDRWTSPGAPDPDDRPEGAGSGEPQDGRPNGHDGSTGGPQQAGPEQPGWKSPQQPQGWSAPPSPPGGGWRQPGWSSGPGGDPNPAGWHAQRYSAAKPGVIPLRPLGVGEILDGAVSTARAHWRPVLAIVLTIAVLTELLSILAIRTWFHDTSGLAALEQNPEPTADEISDALGELFSFTSVVGIVTLLGTVLATALLTMVVSRAVLGERVTVGEAWTDARPQLLRLLGLIISITIAAAAAFFGPALILGFAGGSFIGALGMLAGVFLGIWVAVHFSLAAPALMLERQSVFGAMGRSWRLVTGSWWRVFGIQLLMMVLILLVSSIVQVPSNLLAELFTDSTGAAPFDTSWTALLLIGIGSVIASVVTLPLSAGVTALLYIDRRIRREALDLDLARAAGLDAPRDEQ